MTKAFNKAGEKFKRRVLRKNMPLAEVILWTKLKDKAVKGYKFRRQFSVNNFVIDFYCPKLKLAIEVDGESHFTDCAESRDKERQMIIESFGVSFLRFTNKEIYENINGVVDRISEHMKD